MKSTALVLAAGIALVAAAACSSVAVRTSPGNVSGEALWNALQSQKYAQTWNLWPGKPKLYKGREPHGALLTTYVNGPAYEAILSRQGRMPAGAIVVKENYKPDRTLAAITVMWKVPGYNSEAGDWFWAKYAPDGTALKQGKVPGCIDCHRAAADNDYLYTGPLKP